MERFDQIRDLDKKRYLEKLAAVFLFVDPLVGRTRAAKKEINDLTNHCCDLNVFLVRSMKQTGYLFDGHPHRQTKHSYIEFYREARKLQLLIISQQIKNKKRAAG